MKLALAASLALVVVTACDGGAPGPPAEGEGDGGEGEGDAGEGEGEGDVAEGEGEGDAAEGEGEGEGDGTDARVSMFVAQGMVGRTTISCDDGRTWIADRSWDQEGDAHLCGATDPIICYGDNTTGCSQVWFDGTCSVEAACDCGHSPGFSKGVAFGADRFVASWGWGWPGAIETSTNGVDWTTTFDNDTFGGLVFGADRFVASSRYPQSSPDGVTWSAGVEADFSGPTEDTIWSVRRLGFADVDGGRFVAYASGNTDYDVLLSSDGGLSWWRPSSLPTGCVEEGPGAYGDIIGGNGVILMLGGDGLACRSDDGGETWEPQVVVADRISSSGVFTGSEFLFWGWSGRSSSADGITWTTTAIQSDDNIGPVARNDAGTLVAVNNVWLGYEEQRFLRSTDGGLVWEMLPTTSFAPSHPIFFITSGLAEPSALCPLP